MHPDIRLTRRRASARQRRPCVRARYSIFGGIFSQPRLTAGCAALKPRKNLVGKKEINKKIKISNTHARATSERSNGMYLKVKYACVDRLARARLND
jgi:hypothetical protein